MLKRDTNKQYMPKPIKPKIGRPRAKDKRQSVTIRLSRAEQDDLARMAHLYPARNVSRWVRFAVFNCCPTPEQAEALKFL